MISGNCFSCIATKMDLFGTCMKQFERKPEEKPYNLTKGIILFNLAKGYQEVGDRPQAILSYHQAIELFTRVAKVDSHEQWRLDAAISAVNKL